LPLFRFACHPNDDTQDQEKSTKTGLASLTIDDENVSESIALAFSTLYQIFCFTNFIYFFFHSLCFTEKRFSLSKVYPYFDYLIDPSLFSFI